QVNLEYLGQVVWTRDEDGKTIAYPDTVVGTDSHTTMINGLGVLGWGVGGIEAEAAMLGQPISMVLPEVIGVKLTGRLREGIIATDLVLTITEMLRKRGVVGKFVEFFGPGLSELPLADRATIANMAPEYGATCGFFPVDKETINYLTLTSRDPQRIALVEAYCKEQGMWRDDKTPDPVFTDVLHLDLSTVEPSMAGPKRPQDRVTLSHIRDAFDKALAEAGKTDEIGKAIKVEGSTHELHHGDVVIAAITSCTNTSNPSALMAAGLLAKKALEKGLQTKPWVKTSLAPGSKVVTDYLDKAGLQMHLNDLGFNLVGYGCTTCIGNSGPLPESIDKAITNGDLVVSSVLSGNRNFEGRVHPSVKANWLASPPLVVAFALAGTTRIDLQHEPIGKGKDGQPVYLKDIWPTNAEVAQEVVKFVTQDMFHTQYADVFTGDADWKSIRIGEGKTYSWNHDSTYIQNPPYFEHITEQAKYLNDVHQARVLALLGDSITTDHISPAGSIKPSSPAGKFLQEHGVSVREFNSYGARRGNHLVMMRGTFANIRIRNEMVPGVEGGFTKYIPNGETMPIYDAAMKYKANKTPLVIFAGKEYGTGSSRDWAAKGTLLLGVKAVIAESFERIHRSNLVGMGVLPLEFKDGMTRKSLNLDGTETVDITGIEGQVKPRMTVKATITRANGSKETVDLTCRIDTEEEIEYFRKGGILQYVLFNLAG
ncbi:MAG: aconitate hydratase AcnA, partial [Gammaproteobacteria bacterium]